MIRRVLKLTDDWAHFDPYVTVCYPARKPTKGEPVYIYSPVHTKDEIS